MRIGLYGGSFDPVHFGHLLVAQAAREEATLDRVVFIPAAQSPFKPERKTSPDKLRLQMLRLALVGKNYCEIDLLELERGGVSYTIDTIREYRSRFPHASIHYVIGADHVPLLPKWRSAAELSQTVEFLAVPRPGQSLAPFPAGFNGRYLKGFPLDISASQIRERVKVGQPVDLLVGRAVADCICDNRLYLS